MSDSAALTIDLDALAANYNQLRARAPAATCAGVVKCSGYGLGIRAVAHRLWQEGCRTFFVAQLNEAAELRRHIPAEAQIYVLNGLAGDDPAAYLDVDAVPVLNHLWDIDAWARLARERERRLRCVIHFDTGMNRLGLGEDETERLLDRADQRLTPVSVDYYMSHLACGARPDHPMNARQERSFNRLLHHFPAAPASLANSAGVFLGKRYHYDLVRPGIAMYGVNPSPDGPKALDPNPLAPVAHVEAPVLQVRHCDSPMTIGYDAGYEVRRPSRIATLAIGYGDGYPRTTYLHGPAFVARGGYKAPVVGKVSMDLITVDVTDLPEPHVEIGERFEVLGQTITVNDLAEAAGTNGYDILTGLGARLGRHYSGEAPPPTAG